MRAPLFPRGEQIIKNKMLGEQKIQNSHSHHVHNNTRTLSPTKLLTPSAMPSAISRSAAQRPHPHTAAFTFHPSFFSVSVFLLGTVLRRVRDHPSFFFFFFFCFSSGHSFTSCPGPPVTTTDKRRERRMMKDEDDGRTSSRRTKL